MSVEMRRVATAHLYLIREGRRWSLLTPTRAALLRENRNLRRDMVLARRSNTRTPGQPGAIAPEARGAANATMAAAHDGWAPRGMTVALAPDEEIRHCAHCDRYSDGNPLAHPSCLIVKRAIPEPARQRAPIGLAPEQRGGPCATSATGPDQTARAAGGGQTKYPSSGSPSGFGPRPLACATSTTTDKERAPGLLTPARS